MPGQKASRRGERIEVASRAFDGRLCRFRYERLKALDLFPHGHRVKQEIAAVPEVTLCHVFGSHLGIRLFNEGFDLMHACAVKLRARTNVYVVRCSKSRRNPESHDAAFCGGTHSQPADFTERVRLADRVIGGKHQRKSLRIALQGKQGSDCNCGTGMAPAGLEHYVSRDATIPQLLDHYEAEFGMRDDNGTCEQFWIGYTPHHLLERRALADKRNELLRHARARPATSACPLYRI